MWTQVARRLTIALVVFALVGACKNKPTEPPDDDEPEPPNNSISR